MKVQWQLTLAIWCGWCAITSTPMTQRLSLPVPSVLKDKDEHPIWIGRCELMQEVTTSEYVGVYGGPSVRIASGLWWRVGGARGHKEVHSSVQPMDEIQEYFAITTHAVYFGGKRCNFRIPFSRVVKINSYRDSVGICKDGGNRSNLSYFGKWVGILRV